MAAKVINYHNGEKIYNKDKVDELLADKQDTIVPDTQVQDNDHLVENQAVKTYVDAETQRAESVEGDLADLDTTDKSNLVAAINEVKQSAYTVDPTVTAGSTNPVESGGIKTYVDDQDAHNLQEAKDYTDSKIGTLDAGDGSTVVELTGHLDDLDNAAESLVSAINAEGNRITAVENTASDLDGRLATERQKRIEGDQRLADMINTVDQAKQDKLTFDDTPTHGSDNPVKSTGIKDYVDEITGQLEDLEHPAESLVSAINAIDNRFQEPDTEMSDSSENAVQNKVIKAYVDDKDDVPTEGSDKAVKSNGIFNAIRFASVKIGEIMDWPQFRTETRTVVSDNPFEFTFNGQTHSVEVPDDEVTLEIADNVPEGWAAMDGTAVIEAAANPELDEFFAGRNTTTEGKIWIPYLARKIIKVAY